MEPEPLLVSFLRGAGIAVMLLEFFGHLARLSMRVVSGARLARRTVLRLRSRRVARA